MLLEALKKFKEQHHLNSIEVIPNSKIPKTLDPLELIIPETPDPLMEYAIPCQICP